MRVIASEVPAKKNLDSSLLMKHNYIRLYGLKHKTEGEKEKEIKTASNETLRDQLRKSIAFPF